MVACGLSGRAQEAALSGRIRTSGPPEKICSNRSAGTKRPSSTGARLSVTGRVVVVEEGHKTGGVAGEIWARITEEAFDWLDAPLVRVAAADSPLPCSPVLEEAALPSVAKIVRAVKQALGRG